MTAELEITKEQFKNFERNEQMGILFQTLQHRNERCMCRLDVCEKKFEKLRNNKRTDRGISALFGIVGGFVAGLFGLDGL